MRTSSTVAALLTALVKARGDFKPVVRDATGQVAQRTYKYADLAGVIDAVVPALTKHGLAVLQTVEAETSTLVTGLYHTSGEFVESAYPLTFAAMTPQQIGAQLSYGRRYSLLALLCVAQEDDDAATVPAHPTASATPQKAAQAPPVAQAPGQVQGEAHVSKVDFDEGVSAKTQKPWQRWRVQFDDNTPQATTFSKTVGEAAAEAFELGALVAYVTEIGPRGVNLVSIEPALF